MRRRSRLVEVVAIGALLAALWFVAVRPLALRLFGERLTDRMASQGQRATQAAIQSQIKTLAVSSIPVEQARELEARGWARVERSLREQGASAEETRRLMVEVRREVDRPRGVRVPVYAVRGSLLGETVWTFGFGWGGMMLPDGTTELPSHYLVLVVSPAPFRVLRRETCG